MGICFVSLGINSHLFGLGLVTTTRLLCHGNPKKPKVGHHFTTFHLSSTDMDKDGFFFFYPSFLSLQNNVFCPTRYGLSLLFAAHPMTSLILIYLSIELSEWLICWIFHSELSVGWVIPESSCRFDPTLSKQLHGPDWSSWNQQRVHDMISWYSNILLWYGFSFFFSPSHQTMSTI